MDDTTWAPQSPDLSAYHSADPEPIHPQHQGYRGSVSHVPPYSPPSSSPILQKHQQQLPALHPHPQQQQLHHPQQQHQHLAYPPPIPSHHAYMPRGVKKEDSDYVPDDMANPRGKQGLEGNGVGLAEGSTALPGTEHINITHHFPVARIKRIMQADDDVGKVAQVTPVVVSKALELFMISLVTKAAAEAKAHNQKRVGPTHLKAAITKDEQFDFLSDIVSKVADAPASKGDGDSMDADGKKKKASGRKKKKVEDDDF